MIIFTVNFALKERSAFESVVKSHALDFDNNKNVEIYSHDLGYFTNQYLFFNSLCYASEM